MLSHKNFEKKTDYYLLRVCTSVRPLAVTRLPPKGFSPDLVFEGLIKPVGEAHFFVNGSSSLASSLTRSFGSGISPMGLPEGQSVSDTSCRLPSLTTGNSTVFRSHS
jgi:hypothetical protein